MDKFTQSITSRAKIVQNKLLDCQEVEDFKIPIDSYMKIVQPEKSALYKITLELD